MTRKYLRLAALGLSTAAALLASAAVPANAASTQGRQSITFDQCITDEEAGLVFCTAGTQQSIEVHTPSGRAIFQGRTKSASTTIHQGGTTTDESAFKSVSVFEWYVDGLNYGPRVIKLKGANTTTFPDGMGCTFETDFISVKDETRFDHGSVTCATP